MRDLDLARGLKLSPDYVGGGTFALLAKKGAGKTYTARVMAEEFWTAGIPFVFLDPMGAAWGLRSSADGNGEGIPVAIFGGDHADVPLERGGGSLMADLVVDEGVSMILDMSALGSRSAERQFAHDFLDRLYRRNRDLVHLLIDEADLFAPQKPAAGDQALLGITENIVRRGRNKGIGITLITQRPAVLNKDVLTQVDGLVCLRVTGLTDRKAIDEWVKGHGDDIEAAKVKESLSSLVNGESWWWIPELDVLKRVQVRASHTFDSSPTKKSGETRRDPKGFADVDLGAIETKMADTIERAKADDPKELRKKIRELEAVIVEKDAALDSAPLEDFEAAEEAVSELTADNDRLTLAIRDLKSLMPVIITNAQGVIDRAEAELNTEPQPHPPIPRKIKPQLRAPAPDPDRRRPIAPRPALPTAGVMGGIPKVVTELAATIACFPEGISRDRLALLTARKPRGGSWNTAMKGLQEYELAYPAGEMLVPTNNARTLFPDSQPMTSDQLISMWMSKLGVAPREIFEVLVGEFPDTLTRDEIGDRTDRAPRGGSWNTAIKELRLAGLIVENGDGLKVNPELM